MLIVNNNDNKEILYCADQIGGLYMILINEKMKLMKSYNRHHDCKIMK